jgi:hypothetical protein
MQRAAVPVKKPQPKPNAWTRRNTAFKALSIESDEVPSSVPLTEIQELTEAPKLAETQEAEIQELAETQEAEIQELAETQSGGAAVKHGWQHVPKYVSNASEFTNPEFGKALVLFGEINKTHLLSPTGRFKDDGTPIHHIDVALMKMNGNRVPKWIIKDGSKVAQGTQNPYFQISTPLDSEKINGFSKSLIVSHPDAVRFIQMPLRILFKETLGKEVYVNVKIFPENVFIKLQKFDERSD